MSTGFLATNPTPAAAEEGDITSAPFWPVISLADMRNTVRLDGTVTTDRLKHAAIDAIISVPWSLTALSVVTKNARNCVLVFGVLPGAGPQPLQDVERDPRVSRRAGQGEVAAAPCDRHVEGRFDLA